jgi:organic radical activating enzyme
LLKGKKNFHATHSEISEKIRTFRTIRHIVLSGGEPTLQNIGPLIEELHHSHSIEVESNGTQIPHLLHATFTEQHYLMAEWNISPKGNNAGQQLLPNALQHWSDLCKAGVKVNFKFVIRKLDSDVDVEEVSMICKTYRIPADSVYLMAEGTDIKNQLESAWLEKICIEHGWRLTPRLHIILHGNERGF